MEYNDNYNNNQYQDDERLDDDNNNQNQGYSNISQGIDTSNPNFQSTSSNYQQQDNSVPENIPKNIYEVCEGGERNDYYGTGAIYVDGVEESGMFVQYQLKGSALQFPVNHKFNDFYLLRKKLVERWPGIYVPSIPDRKIIGNKDKTTIGRRLRTLNRFCQYISNSDYFLKSDEVQMFLHDYSKENSAFSDHVKTLKPHPTETLIQKYSEYFMAADFQKDESLGADITNVYAQQVDNLKQLLKNIELANKKISVYAEEEKNSIKNKCLLLDVYQDYEKKCLFDFSNNDNGKTIFTNVNNTAFVGKMATYKKDISNIMEETFKFFEDKQLDISSMIEALNSYSAIKNRYEKLNKEIKSLMEKIDRLNQGKKNFIEIVTFKEPNELLGKYNLDKENKIKEVQDLNVIINILNQKYAREINQFMRNIFNDFYNHMQVFVEKYNVNLNLTVDLWNNVRGYNY